MIGHTRSPWARRTGLCRARVGLVLCVSALVGFPWASWGAGAQTPIRRQPVRLPPFREIEAQIRAWEHAVPDRLRVEEVGRSQENRPILLCHISDWQVPDDDKQRILFSTMHSAEVDGPVQLLYAMKWLLGEEPLAVRIRRRQRLMITPCMNPDSYTRHRYFNEFGSNLSWKGLRNPEQYPVGRAYDEILRRYKPEAHVGVHSTSGVKDGWMTESFISGDALLRPSDPAIMDILLGAMDQAGFAFVYGEGGKQQIRATRIVPGASARFHGQFSYSSETSYAYHVTKGVPLRTEIGSQESFLIGVRRFMEIGNEVWRGERHRGYPVNRVAMVGPVALAAWGGTAQQRRESRYELWAKIGQISLGVLYPEQKGRVVAVYCSDPGLRGRLKHGARCLDGPWDGFLANLHKEPIAGQYAFEKLREAGRAWPMPRAVWMQGGTFTKGQDPMVQAGISLRLHLPYPAPTIAEVCLDGARLRDYVVYHNPGAIVEVNVPPGQTKPLHIVSLEYRPDRAYKEGFGPQDWALPRDKTHEQDR